MPGDHPKFVVNFVNVVRGAGLAVDCALTVPQGYFVFLLSLQLFSCRQTLFHFLRYLFSLGTDWGQDKQHKFDSRYQ